MEATEKAADSRTTDSVGAPGEVVDEGGPLLVGELHALVVFGERFPEVFA